MLMTIALLAQLAGAVPGTAPGVLPTCGPDLSIGSVCVWRGPVVVVPSTKTADRHILMSILSTGPQSGQTLRHVRYDVMLEYGGCEEDLETYIYHLEFGLSCPLPPPPPQ